MSGRFDRNTHIKRAFGRFQPSDSIWEYKGGYVDAFRPRVESTPVEDAAAVERSRETHFGHVRAIFEKADWLVFTLGLTESWTSRIDGAVYPMAPGVHGGTYSEDKYQFVNFTVQEVIEDLRAFIRLARDLNPGLKFILTVSPVPLIATYEDRHVLVSTVCSKSILRVAADTAEREFENVIYFPSYEIITNPVVGSYFMDDLREVTSTGLQHVMRIFSKHFSGELSHQGGGDAGNALDLRMAGDPNIVCDEEEIERALIEGGVIRK